MSRPMPIQGQGSVKDIDGTPEAENTACKDSRGERRLTDVTFCGLKLSNFETSHRGDATEALATMDYIQSKAILYLYSRWLSDYNSIGRGLTALLILEKGQC